MIKKFIKKNYLIIIIVTLIITLIFSSYYYYKKPIIVKPLYSDDSGFYITLQYELKEDYDLGEDMGKLFGKHSRTTLLDTGSMWIDIGSVMGKHDKKIFKKRLDNLEKVGAPNLLVTDLNYGGDVIEGDRDKDCDEPNDTPGMVETHFLQGQVHLDKSFQIQNLIGYSTIDDSCNHPQWYNDIQEGSTTIFGLDQKIRLPISNYKTYDKDKYKNWNYDDLNAIYNMMSQLPSGQRNIELDVRNLTFKMGLHRLPFFNFPQFSCQGIGDNSMFYFIMTDGNNDYKVLFDTGTAVTWIENPSIKKENIGRLRGKSTDMNRVSGYLDFKVILSQGDPSVHAQKISDTQKKKQEYMDKMKQTKKLNYQMGRIDLIFGRSDMLNHKIFIDYEKNILQFY